MRHDASNMFMLKKARRRIIEFAQSLRTCSRSCKLELASGQAQCFMSVDVNV